MMNAPDPIENNIPVAVIGMGCFFPKAGDLKAYWRLLYHGIDAIGDVPETHWSPEDYFDNDVRKPDRVYCKRGGFLPQIPFDPTAFGIPPANLEATDTSQILGLLGAKRALDDAGYGNGKPFDRNRTSVVLGVTGTQEQVIPLSSRLGFPKWKKALESAGIGPEKTEEVVNRIAAEYTGWQENSFPGLLGNVVAGRICNRLDLNGMNCVVDAACASSMSAINLAIMELQTRRSDLVVTGGVDTLNDIFMHMCFARTQILSPTGDARPFSKDADGTVLGEGVGLIVLKRLDEAERDKDRIYAVIRGIGASSDGKSQSIYAPRAEGQTKALRKAYENAGLDPSSVGLVEAHGTGTRVGDKIELRALKDVFGGSGKHKHCAIGSVKSMIGHTKAAAGTAGLIKTVMALHHRVLPPTLKVSETDPEIGIEESPFYINRQSRPWFSNGHGPRRAGVSAFGFGGSNFHVVLEEYQKGRKEVGWDGSVEIIALSDTTMEGLQAGLADWVQEAESEDFSEALAHRAAESRKRFSAADAFRLLMVVTCDRNTGEWNTNAVLTAAEKLISQDDGQAFRTAANVFFGSGSRPGKLAFVFPGQGSQYCGMGRDIVSWFPEAMAVMDLANRSFKGEGALTDVVYPVAAQSKDEAAAQEDRLRNTAVAQPALGGVSLAMAGVLRRFGVGPEGACGHSYGELAALCAAGWIDEPSLHALSNLRGQLMAAAGGGTMAAVKAPLDKIEALIESEGLDVVLANRNTPGQGVLSGSVEAIEAAEKACKANNMRAIRLQVSAAFHSKLVESARAPFAEALQDVTFTPTDIPVYANTTGKAYPTRLDEIRTLLGNHLRNAVNFVDEITHLHKDGFRLFLEVGPKTVMKGLVGAILKGESHHVLAVDASGGKQFGIEDLAKTLAHLAALGQNVDLGEWESGDSPPKPRKMSVPISGANLKPEPKGDRGRTGVTKGFDPKKENRDGRSSSPANAVTDSVPVTRPIPVSSAPVDQDRVAPDAGQWHAAFAAIEEGVRSMRAIHLQTAQAHEKFLETQAMTAKAIQGMMESTRTLTGNWSPRSIENAASAGSQSTQHSPLPVSGAAESGPASFPESSMSQAGMTEKPSPLLTASSGTSSANTGEVGRTLIGIVSELTGYPPEMLSLEMDLESDLGIDSIKRVEILSAVEARIPGLGSLAPETMAELRTLGQVTEALKSETPLETDLPVHPKPEAAESQAAADTLTPPLSEALLEVVSDLTGYPGDMLSLDMDIEADLGIDSIKRVEILSAMEERLPGLSAVSPDELAELKTLGQIAARLSSTPESRATPGAGEKKAAFSEPVTSGTHDVDTLLLQVVSDLTGYPLEMLTPDMDIEADLGIDSIKRVEILSVMEEKKPGVPRVSPDEMAELKTLGQIAAFLGRDADPAGRHKKAKPMARQPETRESVIPLDRKIPRAIETPFEKGRRINISEGKRIFITTDRSGLANALSETLSSMGLHTVLVSVDILKHRENLPDAAGLIVIADPEEKRSNALPPLDTAFLKDSFALLQTIGKSIAQNASAEGETVFFATISRLDGAFGFRDGAIHQPIQGGLAGLAKTAAKEWPRALCRAIDVDPLWSDPSAIAETVARELFHPVSGAPIEVGLTRNARYTLAESAGTYPAATEIRPIFNNGDVVVISGGARGVTAAAARALAARQPLTLVLLGRSAAPEPEPDWLDGIIDETDVKRAILTHGFPGKSPKPVEVDVAYRHWMGNREMAQTLNTIESSGSTVRYFSVDVRDREKLTAVLSDVRMVHGPVRALIHGAGVLEDRLIVDKTAEQFATVLDTKIKGLENLLAAAAPESLRYVVLFSSAAARYGNRGQSDYAAANEVLNKTARTLTRVLPECRTIALNWGPWDGGMVTGSLRREFLRNGASLISMAAGVNALLHELSAHGDSDVEVVVGSGFPEPRPDAVPEQSAGLAAFPPRGEDEASDLSLHSQQDIDEKSVPVLSDHKLDGKPVLPFALMTEWFAHSALHDNPGLMLSGIDDMRLLKGVVIDNGRKRIRLMAGKTRKSDQGFTVDVELRNGFKDNKDVVHSRATAILSDRLPEAPAFSIPPGLKDASYSKPVKDIYKDILFHGDALQGIRKVESLTPKGMVARLNNAPSPSRWMADPPRNRWIADPLVMDCAYQMASLWCYEQKGQVSLPSYNASYRQYRLTFPPEPILAVLEVRSVSRHKMVGDFTFLDAENRVIATISGHEAIMDRTLMRAFKPETLAATG